MSLLTPSNTLANKAGANRPNIASDNLSAPQAPAEDYIEYLPYVTRRYSTALPPFGVETTFLNSPLLDKADGISTYWLRYPAFSWQEIEPERIDPPYGPVYNWATVNETQLAAASARGINIIAVIKYTPAWAQKYPGFSCGPVAEPALSAFADFVRQVVTRYSVPPYNIHYWELGNEPDVDPYAVLWTPGESYNYGCWGDQNDPYYGGGYYATMLKQVYPAIKEADPQSQVLIGGLLLDCDPTHPLQGQDCLPGKFFEGILQAGGGDYFDLVSYHGHAVFPGWIYDEDHYKWSHRGGVVLGKADFLREIMLQYSVNKPVMLTEFALTCHPSHPCASDPVGTGFYEAQADYVVWVYVRNWANNIGASFWFTLNDSYWRQSGLLYGDLSPKLAYNAYMYLAQELGAAIYVGKLTQYPDLRAYAFETNVKRVWVMWAPDQIDHVINLPEGTTGVYDKYGSVILLPPAPITTTIVTTTVQSPIYIELLP